MRAALDFVRARVGRRVVGLFIVAAGAPLAVGLVADRWWVAGQLRTHADERLAERTGYAVNSIHEQLSFLTAQLEGVARRATGPPGSAVEALSASVTGLLPGGVEGLALEYGGEVHHIAGAVGTVPTLDTRDVETLADPSVSALLRATQASADSEAGMYLALSAGRTDAGSDRRLWARITPDSLWSSALVWVEASLGEDFCVLDADDRPFFCLQGEASSLAGRLPSRAERESLGERRGASGPLEPGKRGDDDVGQWRTVFLGGEFAAPPWIVVMSEQGAQVYALPERFEYNIVVSVLIALAVAVLFSNVLVRRTLDPLEKLTEGTRRIAGQDLSTRVEIASRDEFGDLASSFNTMAERLGHQFRQIEAGRAIDQAVLSASDRTIAVRALLDGVQKVVPSGRAAVLLLGAGSEDEASLFSTDPESNGAVTESDPGLTEAGHEWLRMEGSRVDIAGTDDLPQVFASAGFGDNGAQVLVLRLLVQGEPLGAVAVARRGGGRFSDGEMGRAEQLVDQAAVALNDLRLRRELEDMSWEALRALANAIDAKSKWTAGHSERVTDLSLALGAHLGLGEKDMELLHRGGLLHDLGKIGVPARILDFNGPLDAEMRQAIEAHPVIGAEILGPIRAFAPILPIVLHHHERWDGNGYPHGLAGVEIPRLARLVAVADTFDAMVSARPYRGAMGPWVVVHHIQDAAGTAFDPEFVDALAELLTNGWLPRNLTPEVAIDG